MGRVDFGDLFMTKEEVADFLGVGEKRVRSLALEGKIEKIPGSYVRASVVAYKKYRGDKKGGPYPKRKEEK